MYKGLKMAVFYGEGLTAGRLGLKRLFNGFGQNF